LRLKEFTRVMQETDRSCYSFDKLFCTTLYDELFKIE
jgi:hypothetical protein